MTEGLLESGFLERQERAHFELACEGEEPEAAERERNDEIERVERDVVGESGRREPIEVELTHDQHHDGHAGESGSVALQVARQEQHERQYEMGKHEHERKRSPSVGHAAYVEGGFFGKVARLHDDEL